MRRIHIIGFGSQGSAWAECLKASGWQVEVYLNRREGRSFEKAYALGYAPRLMPELPLELAKNPQNPALIAMLCPDHLIAPLYAEYIAQAKTPLTLVLAHGYAVYAGELTTLSSGHNVALLAPKAIGPKLLAAHQNTRPNAHHLVAAFAVPVQFDDVRALAHGLGFSDENLVTATFEQEAVGDLISEQALLCGGVFTLLEMTMQNMARAGVPDRLIREECLTELELIAGMLRERGPAVTLTSISQAAQAGTIAMRERLLKLGLQKVVDDAADDVIEKRFVTFMRKAPWRDEVKKLNERLTQWDERLNKK